MEDDSALGLTGDQEEADNNTTGGSKLEETSTETNHDCRKDSQAEEENPGPEDDQNLGEEEEDPGEEHEFEIIDQVESEEDDGVSDCKGDHSQDKGADGSGGGGGRGGNGEDGQNQDGDSESSSDDNLDDSELHALLEKDIDRDSIKKREKPTEGQPIIKLKTVLKEFETDPFDILPEGWICVTHNCGMPIYLHSQSRVCTMARPYLLGSASARTHDIPISAIPCLQYRKQVDKYCQDEKVTSEFQDTNAVIQGSSAAEGVPFDTEPRKCDNVVVQASQDPSAILESRLCPNSSAPTSSLLTSSSSPSSFLLSSASCQASHRPLLVTTETPGQDEVLHTASQLGKDELMGTGSLGLGINDGVDKCGAGQLRSMAVMESEAGQGVFLTKTHEVSNNKHIAMETGEVESSGVMMKTSLASHLRPVHGHENITVDSCGTTVSAENLAVKGLRPVSNTFQKPTNASSAERSNISTESGCPDSQRHTVTQGNSQDSPATRDTSLSVSGKPSKDPGLDRAPGPPDDDSVEEGEIVEQNSSSPEKGCSLAASSTPSSSLPLQDGSAANLASSGSSAGGLDVSESGALGEGRALPDTKICPAHQEGLLVREEEASSSLGPSELVTSSSNSLATIKRKIESLRNRRGGKLRRLDNGSGASASAAAWLVENNVAVSTLPFGDANSAVLNTNTTETLKANAAVVKIKTAEERAKESLLDSKTVHGYCSKLFQFKVIEVKKYSSWRERKKHLENKKRNNRPELPSSTKLITWPIPGNKMEATGGGSKRKEFVLNPTGKSYLCILHEYMQRTLKIKPLYVIKELENSKTPYGAAVTINNIEYGTGYASSKKVAKQEAAKETLKILIPDLFNKMSDQEIKRSVSDLSFFDNVKVSDPRVNELGIKVGQPSPYQILQECLRRNFGMGDTKCDVSTQPLKNQKCEFSIKVGKHSATVIAKNKRDGKQLAAQAILAKLHPHVPSWGSLLRLYGTSVEKPIQKPEEVSDVKSHAPNVSVLANLREEMRKLHKQKEAIQVKGKIIISSKDLPNKTVGVDL